MKFRKCIFCPPDKKSKMVHTGIGLWTCLVCKRTYKAPEPITKQSMSGEERNQPCPCLSGKKYKNCHPELDSGFVPPILKQGESIGPYVQAHIRQRREVGYERFD